jgi:hypothetical protein
MAIPMPTREEVLELVNERVPGFDDAKKEELVTSALAVMAEPRYERMTGSPMAAVKMAVARLSR